MSGKNEAQCCARVWPMGAMRSSQCLHKAKVTRNSFPYCGRHDPERIAEQRAAKDAERQAALAEKNARWDAAKAANAEQARRAACFDQLVDALHDLTALYHSTPGHDPTFVDKGRAALARARAK